MANLADVIQQRRFRLLVIRVDVGASIGVGHAMRCLALAHAWRTGGGRVVFLLASDNRRIVQRLTDDGFTVLPATHSGSDAACAERILEVVEGSESWVVLDGYDFGSDLQSCIRASGAHLLVIDDNAHQQHYDADVVLNQNLFAERLSYSCSSETIILRGPRYALLRPEFVRWRRWMRHTPNVACRVLVTMGGSDPANQALRVLEALRPARRMDFEITVVVGGAHAHLEELRGFVSDTPFTTRLLHNVKDMPALMAWADMAIASSGSTSSELMFMGLPFISIIVAENQVKIAQSVAELGAAVNVGWYRDVTDADLARTIAELAGNGERRRSMSQIGRQIVDGSGAERVVAYLLDGKCGC